MQPVISIPEKLASFGEPWAPRLLCTLNGSQSVKVARFRGEFVWHSHPETDEMFYVLSGRIIIDVEGPDKETRVVEVKEGDVYVMPKGVRHRPRTVDGAEAVVMLAEKIGTVNTGDAARGELTTWFREKM